MRSEVGCDTTFSSNTLCLRNVFVQHPALEGADGIALDRAGNVVTAGGLRNAGPLEFPTSPVIVGKTLCLAHSDAPRRDNAPSTAGEVTPDGPDRAKLSCLEDRLPVEGLPLPVR